MISKPEYMKTPRIYLWAPENMFCGLKFEKHCHFHLSQSPIPVLKQTRKPSITVHLCVVPKIIQNILTHQNHRELTDPNPLENISTATITLITAGGSVSCYNYFGQLVGNQYTYNGILFSLIKEGSSDTCYNVDEP